ncbi:diaminopimelate decarboxylase family protein [Promicromonospora alba]|uniref:Diaminopimelate decarboxylase family protein n=1 Tax=Promicromonospora alba TaxID=1616110 RepID=A0ABV9HJV6_9MICO
MTQERVLSVEPMVAPPSERLVADLASVPSPSIVYDLLNLARSIKIIQEDVSGIGGAQLNLALKACHTPGLLRELAARGLGADVASTGELELAVEAGFSEITATGPAFTVDDVPLLEAHGVTLDANSLDQLRALWQSWPDHDFGVRVRVPLPPSIEDGATTFGAGSRFGVLPTDPEFHALVTRARGRLTRLHTHTGQMTPEHLVYKARYLLALASHLPDVTCIDMGGGFYSLYASRSRAVAAMSQLDELLVQWRAETGRPMRLQFEPGGGILGAHGYLVVEALAVEHSHPEFEADIVTVDASAWNYAPWHIPNVLHVDPHRREGAPRPTLIAGNTLYENDFFGTSLLVQRRTFDLPECRVGDRLLMSASGAYTMTNARRFNRLPVPSEFLHTGEGLRKLT